MPTKKTEGPLEKAQRLSKRKKVLEATYAKGNFTSDKEKLIEWIRQEDVIIRVLKGGRLDDDTEFAVLSVEGFKP